MRNASERPSINAPRVWSVIALGTVVILAVGVAAGAILVRSTAPASVSRASGSLTAPVNKVSTLDPHDVNLVVSSGKSVRLTVGRAGTVTTSACSSSGSAASGTQALALDDLAVIYLATARPFWRDIAVGDTGADVSALQLELTKLGYSTRGDGRFGRATLQALIAMAKNAGASDASDWTVFPSSRFIWLPSSSVQISTCELAIGGRAAEGDAFATLAPTVSGARLQVIPANVIPGQRVVTVGSITLAVNGKGVVGDQADLATLAASTEYAEFLSSQSGSSSDGSSGTATDAAPTLSATYQLAKNQSVLSVPAAAVYDITGSEGCVTASGRSYRVSVLGSQLGETYVAVAAGTTLTRVSLSTTKASSCR